MGDGKSVQGRRVPKASAGCIPRTLGECMECGQAGSVTLVSGETLPVIGAVRSTWSDDMPVVVGKPRANTVQTLRDHLLYGGGCPSKPGE